MPVLSAVNSKVDITSIHQRELSEFADFDKNLAKKSRLLSSNLSRKKITVIIKDEQNADADFFVTKVA